MVVVGGGEWPTKARQLWPRKQDGKAKVESGWLKKIEVRQEEDGQAAQKEVMRRGLQSWFDVAEKQERTLCNRRRCLIPFMSSVNYNSFL